MISVEEVDYIAHLARLRLSEEERQRFTGQLNVILDYMEQLNEVSTTGVEPTSHVLDVVNVFRDDSVRPSLCIDDILSNAPEVVNRYVVVPRAVERTSGSDDNAPASQHAP